MYEFARKPLWILSHVLAVVAVLLMVRLGFWQYSRWQHEQDRSELVEASIAADPVPLDEVVDLDDDPSSVDESLRYTRVILQGEWASEDDVVVRSRSLQGSPGGWLVTPLVQPDGTAVAVVRGWVPLTVANAGAPFEGTGPPEGEVVVTGVVGLTQERGSIGPTDPAEGTIDSFARLDLDRLAAQLEVPLEPVWVLLDAMEPPQQGEVLQPVPTELPTPSQNFSYMVQWWVFATIFAVGYLLILRKIARTRAGLDRADVAPVEEPSEPTGSSEPVGPR